MIVLDTTVLVYAVGEDHPLAAPCARLVQAISLGLRASTTVEAIQEFAHVRARRRGRTDAAELAVSYAELLAPLVAVDGDDLRAGLDLFERHDELGAFDSVLAAATMRRADRGLVSADRAFRSVPGLTLHDPGAADFLERLGVG